MSNTRKLRRPPATRTAPRASSAPRCDCVHGSGPNPTPCPRPAYFRVTVVCAEPGCEDAAGSYLLCGTCTDRLLEDADAHPHSPELRVTVL